jgi:hypothetical protein
MKLLYFITILVAPALGTHVRAQPTGSAVALEIADCLLQKAPEQARVLALQKSGESNRIQKEPCGILPFPRPKYNYVNSDLLIGHIKDTFALRVIECAKGTKGFDLVALNFRQEISAPPFQAQLAKAVRKWEKEQGYGSNQFLIPAFRKLELAAKLTSAKLLVKSVRHCDAEFVEVNPLYVLSLASPSLGKLDA